MAMRKAQDKIMQMLAAVGQKYRDSAAFQDALETLGGAAVAAGGQAIFTDMTPEEIALSTLLGGAAAFGARPIAAQVGGSIGAALDKRNPNWVSENIPREVAAIFPGSPGAVMEAERLRRATSGGGEQGAMKLLRDLQLSKYRQNFKGKGDLEGLLTAIGRYSGDNIAQAGVALTTPFFMSASEEVA
jgi:MFS family permease